MKYVSPLHRGLVTLKNSLMNIVSGEKPTCIFDYKNSRY